MAQSSPPRVVLVGCGAVARQFYVPALRALQNAGVLRLSAIVDPAVSAREAVARSFPRAGQAASLEHTTAPAGTLAIIATPPALHAAQALAAFERGWHVLAEKPMASTVGEAAGMIAAAERHGRLLAVNLHHRYFAAARYLQTLCRDWLLGPLVSFSIREGGPLRPPVGLSRLDRTQTRGGVLFDGGGRTFDLLAWWLGEPAEVQYADDAMGGLEANASVQLRYPGGTLGRIQLSRDWPTTQEYRFVFERGIVTWNVNDAAGLTVQLSGASAAVQGTLVTPLQEPALPAGPRAFETHAQCFILQLANVINAVEGVEPLLVTGHDGLAPLQLIEQCYASRRLLPQPWLSPEEASHAAELRAALPTGS